VFPKLLLLDESLAPLHPSVVCKAPGTVRCVLWEQRGIRIIIVTHSPTLVALAEEDSLFLVKRIDSELRIAKASKDDTITGQGRVHPSAISKVVTAPGWTSERFPRCSPREGRNYLLLFSAAGVGAVGVSPPPLFDARLGAIPPLFRSCWSRSRGNICPIAPMLLS